MSPYATSSRLAQPRALLLSSSRLRSSAQRSYSRTRGSRMYTYGTSPLLVCCERVAGALKRACFAVYFFSLDFELLSPSSHPTSCCMRMFPHSLPCESCSHFDSLHRTHLCLQSRYIAESLSTAPASKWRATQPSTSQLARVAIEIIAPRALLEAWRARDTSGLFVALSGTAAASGGDASARLGAGQKARHVRSAR